MLHKETEIAIIINECEGRKFYLKVEKKSKANNRNIYGKGVGNSHYMLIITMKVNGLNYPGKRYKLTK